MPPACRVAEVGSLSAPASRAPVRYALPANLLRRLLNEALISDSDLEAFCLDFFPLVHQQFSDGMARQRKLNLLLRSVAPERIVECLHRYDPEGVRRVLEASIGEEGDSVVPVRRWRLDGWLGCAVIVLAVGIGVTGQRLGQRWYSAARTAPATPPALGSSAQIVPAPVELPLAWLTSDPNGAVVVDLASGTVVGRTPWAPELGLLREHSQSVGGRVCLRLAGFVPVLIELESGTEPSGIRPMHVQLQRELRAGSQHELGQEACNDKTPRIP